MYLDLSVKHSRVRAQKRNTIDLFELRNDGYFTQVRANYLKLAQEHSNIIKVIDAAQSIANVQKQVRLALKPLLDKWEATNE